MLAIVAFIKFYLSFILYHGIHFFPCLEILSTLKQARNQGFIWGKDETLKALGGWMRKCPSSLEILIFSWKCYILVLF